MDGKFSGILDQGKGHLLVFDDNSSDKTYAHSLKTIKKMDEVVESLFVRAKQIQTAWGLRVGSFWTLQDLMSDWMPRLARPV